MYLERLKEYINHLGISMNKFEDSINTSRGNISGAIRNNRNIGGNVVENILQVYDKLNSEWWFRGIGEMEKSAEDAKNTKTDIEDPNLVLQKMVSESSNEIKPQLIELIEQFNEGHNIDRRVKLMELFMAKMFLEFGELKEVVKQSLNTTEEPK